MKRTKSSRQWLDRHFKDVYVQRAQKEHYRSRAAYKLLEIQEKDHLFKPGMVVVDLGSAPGSWSEIAIKTIGRKGRVIAIDKLPMDPITGVQFIQGDFTEAEVCNKIRDCIAGHSIDIVMSDIAPNSSGVKAIDQPRMMVLVELALDFAREVLKRNGDFLVKVFQGEGFDEYIKCLRHHFTKLVVRKPKASRPKSKEVYLLARGYKNRL